MPRNKIYFKFDGMDYYIKKLDEMGKRIDLVTEKCLIESKKYVTNKLEQDSIKPNYPHEGDYSIGTTKDSIDKSNDIGWEGSTAYIKVGYDFNISGLTSIFLMYGVEGPGKRKIDPVKKLYNDIYGYKTRKEVAKLQEEIFKKAILDG